MSKSFQRDQSGLHSLVARAGSECGMESGLGRMSLKHTPDVSRRRALSWRPGMFWFPTGICETFSLPSSTYGFKPKWNEQIAAGHWRKIHFAVKKESRNHSRCDIFYQKILMRQMLSQIKSNQPHVPLWQGRGKEQRALKSLNWNQGWNMLDSLFIRKFTNSQRKPFNFPKLMYYFIQ